MSKSNGSYRQAVIVSSALVLGSFGIVQAFGQGFGGRGGNPGTPGLGAPAIDLYAAGVAGSRARGNSTNLNDLETTAITRMELQLVSQMNAVTAAQEALTEASYRLPVNQADLQAKAQALADAETALALARADAFPRIKAELKLTGERLQDFIRVITGTNFTAISTN